ncbi:uncharacterized protein TNCV_2832031 [Trichonephila clavipes]|nr:uncharacterized protein TNCV_2832031 [Trichonephila clavipes]
MVSWEYLWPTLCCRREAGVGPLLSIGWWYLTAVFPKRHCCRVSAADNGCWVYPLDPRPNAVALYSGCTPEARKLIVPQQSQTYAPVAKSSTISATTQTDDQITKIICPPLHCLKPVSSANQIPRTSPSMPTVSTSSSSTQAQLLPSTSSVTITLSSESQPPILLTNCSRHIYYIYPCHIFVVHTICHFTFDF